MLYLAIPAHNEVATIGVLLWRLRTVLDEFPREYEVVVYDDASTDETADVAEQYASAMPVTVIRGKTPVGYAGALDALVRHVSAATRYPRRDAFLLLQGDFTDPPGIVPEFARRFEGGADVVVGERTAVVDAPIPVKRLFSTARWTLRPFIRVHGVRDLTGSMRLVRISVLRDLLRASGDTAVADGDSWTANADFLLRLVPHARRVESVPMEPTYGVRMRETRRATWRDAVASLRWGWTARGRKATPTTAPEAAPDRGARDGSRDGARDGARDVARDSSRDVTRETARETRETGREGTRESTRESTRDSAGAGARRGRDSSKRDAARDATLRDGSLRESTPRSPRVPKGESRPDNSVEPRARRAPRGESLEESAERAAERESARSARRDASREEKGGTKREGRSTEGRNATPRAPRRPAGIDETLTLSDPFAPPPRRDSPFASLDDDRAGAVPDDVDSPATAGTSENTDRSPYADDEPASADANARAGSAGDEDGFASESGEGEGEAAPGRKRRRNRRGRRRRGRDGTESAEEGAESANSEADSSELPSDTDDSSDADRGIEIRIEPTRHRRDRGTPPQSAKGHEESGAAEVQHADSDDDSRSEEEHDGASEGETGTESDSEARARRRGRRGRRGGARRSRGRGKRSGGDASSDAGSDAGGESSGDDSPAGNSDRPSNELG